MSQIKLLHSGGNGVIIAAPDSNPTQDRTLKLPSDGDGTILTTNSSVGKILQVVQTFKKDTFSTSNNDHTEITGLNASIAKTIASSKILISVDIGYGRSGRDSTEFKLYEDSSELTDANSTGATSDNCFIVDYNHLYGTTYETYSWYNVSKKVLIDGQNDTSSHTYKVYGHSNAATLYINRRSYNTTELTTSAITLMEVAT